MGDMVPGVGFEPTSPRLQRVAKLRLDALSPDQLPRRMAIGAADGNRTHVCALAPRGSAIELRTLKQDRFGRLRRMPQGLWTEA